jgi:ketosteroid isomerase-like protein
VAEFNRDDYVKLVEVEYFGGVVRQDKEAVLACFTADAHVTIYHGDNAPRRFSRNPGAGETPLIRFFDHLLANYDPHFEDFTHYVDADNDRCATHFRVRLTPKADSLYLEAGVQILQNCNFFRCRAGKIDDMILYYANPASANAAQPAPTGFPKTSETPHGE